MWGHNILFKGGTLESAKQHFASALASSRERPYVRDLQFAALLNNMESSTEIEAARVAGEMRKAGEQIDERLRDRIWTYVYYAGLMPGSRRTSFMRDLSSMKTQRAKWMVCTRPRCPRLKMCRQA